MTNLNTKRDLVTPEQVSDILNCSLSDCCTFLPTVLDALFEQNILNLPTVIAAIATIGVETNGFRPIAEYGNYEYFTRNYENRDDLGNTEPGDGARYHGRGFIQITGRANYRSYGDRISVSLEAKPDLALGPLAAAKILALYFVDTGISKLANSGDWQGVRRAVNGGLNGWDVFSDFVEKAKSELIEVEMTYLEVLNSSWLKVSIAQSNTLTDDQKHEIKVGDRIEVLDFALESDHVKVTLAQPIKGITTWYYHQKVGMITQGQEIVFPEVVQLNVPYLDQLDNSEDPYGTCNLTSVAMCLSFFGKKPTNPCLRFPDDLHQYCDVKGIDRHTPSGMATVVEAYGCRDDFTATATTYDVKKSLIQGKPVITHGYFTSGGHIVCLVGFNKTGFIVNDPYGEIEWTPSSSHYDIYKSGKQLTYSYAMISATCQTNQQWWCHMVSGN